MQDVFRSVQVQNFLRMTAKSTQFGKRTFSSWLIESSGALPLKRRMDYDDTSQIDNTEVMNTLYQVLVRIAEM